MGVEALMKIAYAIENCKMNMLLGPRPKDETGDGIDESKYD